MDNKKIFVVGDKFKKFHFNQGVISITALEEIISNKIINLLSSNTYIITQGVSKKRVANLMSKISELKLSNSISIECDDILYKKEKKLIVHKHKSKNVLISKPVQIKEAIYKGFALIDDTCAEMTDHITGQHLQGMLLIEISRQFVTAIIERHLLLNSEIKYGFMLKSINVEFLKFVFPLPILLSGKVCSAIQKGPSINDFSFLVTFTQAEETVCSIQINIAAYESRIFSNFEKIALIQTMKKIIPIENNVI